MSLDLTPGKRMRVGAPLPRTRQPDRSQPRRRIPLPTLRATSRTGDTRSQQQLLRALAQLPEAQRAPSLRLGRTAINRPSMSGRVRPPAPILDRLLAGEFQRRLVMVLVGVALFVVVIVALGASFFV